MDVLNQSYKETKLVKRGLEKTTGIMKELADWIKQEFDTKVLHIYYDRIEIDKNRPRLDIIFEYQNEMLGFTVDGLSFNSKKQNTIANKFKEILIIYDLTKNFDTENLLVIFSAFEPEARIEANWAITKKEIKQLKERLADKNVWEVYQNSSTTTIFFYTNKQIQESISNGLAEIIKEKYFLLLKKHDEFDYIKANDNFIEFDSKENFETIYKGNWFYYYKR